MPRECTLNRLWNVAGEPEEFNQMNSIKDTQLLFIRLPIFIEFSKINQSDKITLFVRPGQSGAQERPN